MGNVQPDMHMIKKMAWGIQNSPSGPCGQPPFGGSGGLLQESAGCNDCVQTAGGALVRSVCSLRADGGGEGQEGREGMPANQNQPLQRMG